MKISYRLFLVSSVSLALVACGTPAKDSTSASLPKVSGSAAAGSPSATPASEDAKMSMIAPWNFTFSYSGPVDHLPSSATGYSFQNVSQTNFLPIADFFGLKDAPSSEGFSLSWVEDSVNFEGKSLWASLENEGYWWFSNSNAYPVADCVTYAEGSGDSEGGEAEVVKEVAPPDTVTTDTAAREDCAYETPENVVSAETAEQMLKDLIQLQGFDISAFKINVSVDEWSTYAYAEYYIDGQPTGLMFSVSFAPEGELSFAGGFTALPTPLDAEYPLISVEEALVRLNENMGWSKDYMYPALEPAIEPAMYCSEEDMAADRCSPMVSDPIHVTLTDVDLSVSMFYTEDGEVLLVPNYVFSSADGSSWSVIAIADEFYLPSDPLPAPTDSIAVDPLPVETIVDVPSASPELTTPGEDPQGSEFETLIGLTPEEATAAVGPDNTVRVVVVDGEHLAVTMDYVNSRINVAVVDGIIVEIVSMG